MDCIVCKKPLENLPTGEDNHPKNGLAFTTPGHYGCGVFDPMNGDYLEINLCDPCVVNARTAGRILIGSGPTTGIQKLRVWR